VNIARPEKGLAAKWGEGARLQLAPRASNTMRECPCYLRLRAQLMMPLITGKTNVRPVDGPAVTDGDKH
jgi:hypothetical protein